MKFVINRIEATMGRTPKTVMLLPEGITHRNYLIDSSYVYKRKSPGRHPFYDADADFHANTLMAAHGRAPKIIFFSKEDNEIIYKYYPGTTRLPIPVDDASLEQVALTLHTLHTSNSYVEHNFNLTKMISYYKEHGAENFADLKFEEKVLELYENYHAVAPSVLCHNDVVRGNLLFQDGHLILIDYEYAGMNDPLFDHLSFLSENNIDDENTIKRYFSFVKDVELPLDQKKITVYLLAADLLWYYWASYLTDYTQEAVFEQIRDEKAARIHARRHQLNI